ncbi:pyridine nucleotide-disulfide oxidoreductase family protein [Burkholderia thailandensis USAMRU Malaysia |uniref:Ferredoxin reductase n=1 Tax=Burkholderia thailandensis (strain ATCC 700388 / DSM 13276 / CCUG 48851 / CIP 106301 / E264) TaxID=271848 RepID=Q2T808_BURTA|nr:anthranilate 1,2-dioxygenase system ferredoxin--NAD(+) reductase [Burkholderia thailandensis]ABC34974.1 ferredoxin reductase [Burkholderia thailandensis E264]AHI75336.1 pyridine nucleotide-disulfide oxidoreductase family protein [Burkholderia thailandensis 2002721723]AHI80932.1 pyridine nucleotide-disulfide oxidoreductase family protein [Burkholderia thailandensis E444]AIC90815.1 pyridine nucleotide-disulfide oxidoreductase family protein [Burkholderia thailandensis USAMRU Malaysia \
MSTTDPYLIAGGGHAARRAAETLRERDPAARIVMIGEEPELPYDRPALSKEALVGGDEGERRAFVRDAAWYRERGVELRLGVRVEAIERGTQRVRLSDGASLGYARLLIATGSRVRRFRGPVDAGVPIHYVRTVADARALRAALAPGRRVAVLGGGFIGLEVAASAVRLGCRATIVDPAPRLLQRGMPEVVGAFALALHARHGVDVRLGALPERIRRGANGAAVVETSAGDIAADVVVAGIGVVPNVELAQAAGLHVDDGISVDERCRTADAAIFAAGEVTRHFNPLVGRRLRIESWQVAEHQPAVAAANILGGHDTYEEWPWLWSDQHDCNLQTLGVFDGEQTLVLRGSPELDRAFCVFALNARRELRAVAAVNAGREIAACRRLMTANVALDPARLADPTVALRSMLRDGA